MRNSWNGVWLVVGLLAAVLVLSRIGRSAGPIGLIVVVAIAIIAFNAMRAYSASSRRGGIEGWRAPSKNVTPVEPAIDAPAVPAPEPAIARRSEPQVIVVERAEPLDSLEAKLQALDRLRANGLVTDDEYEAKRAQLIADF